MTKGIFDADEKYIIKVNYIEFILQKYITGKNDKSNSYTKELDDKFEDDFDVKFNNYIDSKMNYNKSEIKKNHKPNNNNNF